MGFPGGTVVKNLPANARDVGSIPGSRRYLGVANCKLLQYPCPENSMDREPDGLQSMGLQRLGHTYTHRSNVKSLFLTPVLILLKLNLEFFLLFFAAWHGLQDLSFQPGIEPRPTAVKSPSPNHWTTREFTQSRKLNEETTPHKSEVSKGRIRVPKSTLCVVLQGTLDFTALLYDIFFSLFFSKNCAKLKFFVYN